MGRVSVGRGKSCIQPCPSLPFYLPPSGVYKRIGPNHQGRWFVQGTFTYHQHDLSEVPIIVTKSMRLHMRTKANGDKDGLVSVFSSPR